MPRKPNYKFERYERDRAKAEKKAARMEAKAARRKEKKGEASDDDVDVLPDSGTGPDTED